jgi:hypothetical protein
MDAALSTCFLLIKRGVKMDNKQIASMMAEVKLRRPHSNIFIENVGRKVLFRTRWCDDIICALDLNLDDFANAQAIILMWELMIAANRFPTIERASMVRDNGEWNDDAFACWSGNFYYKGHTRAEAVAKAFLEVFNCEKKASTAPTV